MATIEFSYKDLCKLVGKKIPMKELEEEAILYVKGEFESVDNDIVKVEIADTNRPDLWSVEGIARELRGRYNISKGLPKHSKDAMSKKSKKSGLKVFVSKELKNIRPLTACAVIKNINITDEILKQIIQLQEKVCETFGKNRKEAAIGVYDYNKIKGNIHFKAFNPRELKFQPLDYPEEITLLQILSKHPKGREYASLLEGMEKFPVFIDDEGNVLSMPPIINSNHTGKVTEETKDLFIECSGYDFKYILPALNVLVAALIDRGGTLETVDVVYEDKKTGIVETPDFSPKKIFVEKSFVKLMTGMDLKDKDIVDLLRKSRFDVNATGDGFEVMYSPIRQDIMHQVDIVEEILINYGYNNITPESISFISEGKLIDVNALSRIAASIMANANSIETMSYILTNKDNLFRKMRLENAFAIEVDNPVSKNWSVFRTWIIPNLLEIFSKNTNREYPQDIFEVGEVVLLDEKAETRSKNPARLAWAYAGKDSDFTLAKQKLEFLLRELGLKWKFEETSHNSFIEGRCARVSVFAGSRAVKVAYIGEIHPAVLEEWGIKMPVSAFELNLSDLLIALKLNM